MDLACNINFFSPLCTSFTDELRILHSYCLWDTKERRGTNTLQNLPSQDVWVSERLLIPNCNGILIIYTMLRHQGKIRSCCAFDKILLRSRISRPFDPIFCAASAANGRAGFGNRSLITVSQQEDVTVVEITVVIRPLPVARWISHITLVRQAVFTEEQMLRKT